MDIVDNIIIIDFKRNHRGAMTSSLTSGLTPNNYLKQCADALDENDFKDLMDAIDDPKFYDVCDSDIQDLVDGYYAQLYKR